LLVAFPARERARCLKKNRVTVDITPVSDVTTPATIGIAALSDDELSALVAETGGRERSLSKKRSRLHDRMDFLRGGGADSTVAAEQLRGLEAEERTLSDERRSAHNLLEALSAERVRRGDRR
jgi:hypothetical protein